MSIRTLAKIQWMLLVRFIQALEQRGIPYALLKGTAAALLLYEEIGLRCGLDLDVGVPSNRLAEAETVARDLGFVASLMDAERTHFFVVDPNIRLEYEQQHYELACLVRRQVVGGLDPEVEGSIRRTLGVVRPWHLGPEGELSCYVTLDVHHGICLDIPVDDLVNSAMRTLRNGVAAAVPRPAWLMLHLIFKIYWEGVHNYRKGAHQFADVVRLVPHFDRAESLLLANILKRYELEAAAHYVLRRIPTHFGVELEPTLANLVREQSATPADVSPEQLNDAGDMWPKVWGYR